MDTFHTEFGSYGWFPVASCQTISFNETCIKQSYYSTSVSTVLTYVTLSNTDTISTVHTSVERAVDGWMIGKIWNGVLYHLSCSTPLFYLLWLDCLHRRGCWFLWCLFCFRHDNHKQANRMCQCERKGFSTCLNSFVHTNA